MTTNSPTNTNQASEEHLNNDKDLKQKLMALKTTDKALELGKLLSYKEIEAVMKVVSTHTQSKLKAFAGDFEALLKNQPMPKRGDVVPDIYVEVLHRIEGANATRGEIRQALKAIKERWNV